MVHDEATLCVPVPWYPVPWSQIGEKTADRFAASMKCVNLIREYAKKISDLNDEIRRDKELLVYAAELGVPVDWFAAKRKDKIAEVQGKAAEVSKPDLVLETLPTPHPFRAFTPLPRGTRTSLLQRSHSLGAVVA